MLETGSQGWVHYFTGLMTSQSSAQQQQQQVQQEQLQQQQQQLRRSQSELMQQQWKVDRRVGCISIAMWLGTAVRVWSFLSLWENMQSVVAMSTMYLMVIAWPTYATDSYMRWRLPAVSFLRVFLVALPFNFSTTVFNAIAPNVGNGGRFAALSLGFQAFLAVRIALLTFTSLGWRVPFRLHLLLQSINVGLLVYFGLHPYCDSKLMRSPEMQGAAASLHRGMGVFASVFLPNVAVSSPQGPDAQRVAFLLFCWAIGGWLVPTLLLLPDTEAAAPSGPPRLRFWLLQPAEVLLGKLMAGFERGLNTLRPPWLQALQRPQQRQDALAVAGDGDEGVADGDEWLAATASFVLAWSVVVLMAWLGACLLARP